MKKTTKKLLTLALSTLFVGAGVGSVVALNNAYDKSGITASAEASVQTVDLASAIQKNGTWGLGDFAGNMAHIRLNAQVGAVWTEAHVAVNNAH
ncbi:MAG: hypothetical protein IJ284_00005, partial [Clostridia bacterium]|nr:hypothetical protein [Clostridia bacterium]